MRRHIIRSLVALTTFALGVWAALYLRPPVSPSDVSAEVHPSEAVRVCELHGVVLEKVRARLICGEYHDDGGSLGIPCEGAQDYRITAEDAMFLHRSFNFTVGTLSFWEDYKAAEKARFPHGLSYLDRVCASGEAGCEAVDVCPKCRAAQLTWRHDALRRYWH